MDQTNYNALFEKYIAGETSLAEDEVIGQYLTDYPLNDAPVMVAQKQQIGRRIKSRLLKNTTRKTSRHGLIWTQAIAASVLVIIGLAWALSYENAEKFSFSPRFTQGREGDFVVKNTSGKPKRVTLEDGSEIVLQPGSQIGYPEHFGEQTRLVYLHGEAFFQVKRNPAKPFIVSTDNLATQVLGTSFHVKSDDKSGKIEVEVVTGRVSVYEVSDSRSNSNGVILTPNQKIIFDKDSRKIELGIVKNPAMVKTAASRQNFEFSETPVREAFEMLESSYGIDIVVESDVLDGCLFTGDLNDLSLFEQLDLICKSVNVDYERRGTSLFVHGEGCPAKP